jgi:multidrug efflux pump
MVFSVLMALTLTPALCASLLKPMAHGAHQRGFFGWFNRQFQRTSLGYQSGVARVLRWSTRTLLVYGVIVLAMVGMLRALPTSFLPEEDQGYFITLIQLPPGASTERTQAVLSRVEQYYMKQPEVRHVIGVLGFSFFGRGQNAATAFVPLKDWSERTAPEHNVTAVVGRAFGALSQIKDAIIFPLNVPPIPELGAVGGFDFRLQDRSGAGRERLLQVRNMVLGMARNNPVLAQVRPQGQEPAPQLMLHINRLKAQAMGVDIAELNDTLQSTLGTNYINDFVLQGRVLRVQMQAEPLSRSTIRRLLRLPVRNSTGGMVPLSEFCTAVWEVASPKLDRYNGLPAMQISGKPAPGHSTGEAMAAMEQIAAKLPPGFGYVFVVFLSLAALYESWSIPVAVLLVVPIGILGALGAVWGRNLSAMALQSHGPLLSNDVYFKVGLIVIIGLAAKNAILIIQFARELQHQGHDLVSATIEACRLRLRPILMTSIAFMFGVLPLAISSGAGANARHALGTGVMGGMLAATAIAIFMIPVFFVTVRHIFPGKREPHHGPAGGGTNPEEKDHA